MLEPLPATAIVGAQPTTSGMSLRGATAVSAVRANRYLTVDIVEMPAPRLRAGSATEAAELRTWPGTSMPGTRTRRPHVLADAVTPPDAMFSWKMPCSRAG
jgi:hypothetical protein